jgi:NAD(P)H dehydrogenase (quinone)
MYVVAGVTGHTGRAVASELLARGEPVRVIVREEGKGAEWKKKGAEVAVASLDESGGLTRALSGASGAYLLIPPQYTAEDLIAALRRTVEELARSVRSSGIRRVVLLSSIGAQHAKGTGPIQTLHDAERAVGDAVKSFTSVRAAYFLENWAGVLRDAQEKGVLPSFLTPGRAIPMVGTRDIGRVAAEMLLDPSEGRRVVELSGPREWSPEDIAAELSRLLRREVRVQAAPLEAVVPAMTAAGMSVSAAKTFQEMIAAINSGLVSFEEGTAIRRRGSLGPADVLGPLLAGGRG